MKGLKTRRKHVYPKAPGEKQGLYFCESFGRAVGYDFVSRVGLFSLIMTIIPMAACLDM